MTRNSPVGAEKRGLFSLELFVHSIRDLRLKCQQPAVGFRFMDFPLVVVYRPDPPLPGGSHEIVFECGKSCLFRLSSQILEQFLPTHSIQLLLIDVAACANMPQESVRVIGSGRIGHDMLLPQPRDSSKELGSGSSSPRSAWTWTGVVPLSPAALESTEGSALSNSQQKTNFDLGTAQVTVRLVSVAFQLGSQLSIERKNMNGSGDKEEVKQQYERDDADEGLVQFGAPAPQLVEITTDVHKEKGPATLIRPAWGPGNPPSPEGTVRVATSYDVAQDGKSHESSTLRKRGRSIKHSTNNDPICGECGRRSRRCYGSHNGGGVLEALLEEILLLRQDATSESHQQPSQSWPGEEALRSVLSNIELVPRSREGSIQPVSVNSASQLVSADYQQGMKPDSQLQECVVPSRRPLVSETPATDVNASIKLEDLTSTSAPKKQIEDSDKLEDDQPAKKKDEEIFEKHNSKEQEKVVSEEEESESQSELSDKEEYQDDFESVSEEVKEASEEETAPPGSTEPSTKQQSEKEVVEDEIAEEYEDDFEESTDSASASAVADKQDEVKRSGTSTVEHERMEESSVAEEPSVRFALPPPISVDSEADWQAGAVSLPPLPLRKTAVFSHSQVSQKGILGSDEDSEDQDVKEEKKKKKRKMARKREDCKLSSDSGSDIGKHKRRARKETAGLPPMKLKQQLIRREEGEQRKKLASAGTLKEDSAEEKDPQDLSEEIPSTFSEESLSEEVPDESVPLSDVIHSSSDF